MTNIPVKSDRFKIASDIFQDMRSNLADILRDNPEIVEDALKKRNTIIKCLKADKEHMLIVFKEISARYEEIATEADKLKIENAYTKQVITKLELEKKTNEQNLMNTHRLFKNKQEECLKIRDEKTQIVDEYNKTKKELDVIREKAILCEDNVKKTLAYRLDTLFDKFPNRMLRAILKFLVSPQTLKFTIFFIFCVLFTISVIGWPAFFSILKPLLKLFL